MTNKLVILLKTEDGKMPKYIKELSSKRINPLKLLDDKAHNLKKLYKDAFKHKITDAKDILEEVLLEQNSTSPLIFKLIEELNKIKSPVVMINSALLSPNDLSFLGSIYENAAFLSPIELKEETCYVFTSTLSDDLEVYNDINDVKTDINKLVEKIYGTNK